MLIFQWIIHQIIILSYLKKYTFLFLNLDMHWVEKGHMGTNRINIFMREVRESFLLAVEWGRGGIVKQKFVVKIHPSLFFLQHPCYIIHLHQNILQGSLASRSEPEPWHISSWTLSEDTLMPPRARRFVEPCILLFSMVWMNSQTE